MTERMTWEQLAVIRSRAELATPGFWQFGDIEHVDNEDAALAVHAREDILALLDEVDRLQAENNALRPIVESVADGSLDAVGCSDCGSRDIGGRERHKPGCTVVKARTVLAQCAGDDE